MQEDSQYPSAPERIGNYQRVGESPLGAGGMGVVWLYREMGISSREVAIKFIKLDENLEHNKASLIKDIKALEALPLQQNIIAMYAVIEEQGNIALVMEYVPGGMTLKKVIQGYPQGLPVPMAKEILAGILSGVAHAHEHGVIHRDLKPDNILMRQPKQGAQFGHNSAKIVDFGISKVRQDGTRHLSTVMAFTEAYAAPEQINGEDTGGFTDVYAIGVVLYEMLSGRKPFEGKTIEILSGHCFKPPPPLDRADLPSGMKKLLDKALQKEPANRYRDAIEMLADYRTLDRMGDLGLSDHQPEMTTQGEGTAYGYGQEDENYDRTIVSGEKKKVASGPPIQKDISVESRREDTERIASVAGIPYAADEGQGQEDCARTVVSGEKRKVVSGPFAQAEAAAERRRVEEQANREFEARRVTGQKKRTLGSKTIIIAAAAAALLAAVYLFIGRDASAEDKEWKAVMAGFDHTVALKADGTIWAWGNNIYGRLGDGTETSRSSPVQVDNSNDWNAVMAGLYHTLAIKSDGSLWAWGLNKYGQLGDGTKTNRRTPVQVGFTKDWAAASAGDIHTVALKTNGTVWAWGNNSFGQLGDGGKTDRNSPVQVGDSKDWTKVSAGYGHTVALKADGTLWAWGWDKYGQLGNGTKTDRSSPVQVGTSNDWAAVSAGASYTVALKKDGTVWAWGSNSYGRLGDGTETDKSAPVQVGSEKDWAAVSAGRSHVVALKKGGTVWAWGWNEYGQLGDGAKTNRSSPAKVGNSKDWAEASAGRGHAVALKKDGTIWAWGWNKDGQLGDGTEMDRSAPVKVGVGVRDSGK